MSIGESRYPKNGYRPIRKDYSKKNLENPFQKNNRNSKKNKLTLKFKIFFLLFLLLIVFLLWLMFFSKIFLIKNIEIDGLYRINNEEIKLLVYDKMSDNRYLLGKQDNLLIFDKNDFSLELKDKYHFKEVKTSKKLFHTLKIFLNEREYSYVWGENNNYYYIDEEGYLVSQLNIDLPPIIINKEASSTPQITNEEYFLSGLSLAIRKNSNAYPLIINKSEERLIDNILDIDIVYLNLSKKIFNDLKGNNDPELNISYFLIDKDYNTIKVILENNLTIYFSTKEDQDKQIKNLILLKKELKNDFNNLIKKKIDLRYGDKVYYE